MIQYPVHRRLSGSRGSSGWVKKVLFCLYKALGVSWGYNK